MRRRPSCQRRASRDFVASPKRYAETGIREALLPSASQIGRSRRQRRHSSARLTSSRLIAGLREPNGQTVPTPQALLIACASCIHKLSTASLPVPWLRMPSPRRHCAYALRHCFIKLLARPKPDSPAASSSLCTLLARAGNGRAGASCSQSIQSLQGTASEDAESIISVCPRRVKTPKGIYFTIY